MYNPLWPQKQQCNPSSNARTFGGGDSEGHRASVTATTPAKSGQPAKRPGSPWWGRETHKVRRTKRHGQRGDGNVRLPGEGDNVPPAPLWYAGRPGKGYGGLILDFVCVAARMASRLGMTKGRSMEKNSIPGWKWPCRHTIMRVLIFGVTFKNLKKKKRLNPSKKFLLANLLNFGQK